MSEIGVAPEQDAIAESLLGEPEEQATQDTGAEEVAQPEEQQVEEQPTEQAEEVADDWLPTEQEKVFPDDVLRQYAERRYPQVLQMLDNDPTNGELRQLLHDKLNTDIFLRTQQQQPVEEYEEEAEPEPTPQAQPQITREQYFSNLDRMVAERTDPEVAKAFHADFLKAFGVPDAEIAKMPADQAMRFTSTASKYMLNLVSTFLPDMLSAQLGPQLSQAFPGFGEMYERSAYAMAWDRVRNSDAAYQNLPAYGTKEFSKTLREASSRIPGFDEMQFTDGRGNALPPLDNAMRKYAMLAQMASGQSVDPRLLQQAAASGAKAARRADVRRSAANLGSGQSKGASQRTSSRFQTNEDIFGDDTMEIYQREHGRI